MTDWLFEPGHTEAAFRARHMMITWVRGAFKDVHGTMTLDRDDWLATSFRGEVDATKVWTGEPTRDAHLRSPDFLAVDEHPAITFEGRFTERTGDTTFRATCELTIRGLTHPVTMDVAYLGEWATPFWEEDVNRGLLQRVGFEASARIDRLLWDVAWQDHLPGGGVVVSRWLDLQLDVEAIRVEDLEATGAIDYYRQQAPAT